MQKLNNGTGWTELDNRKRKKKQLLIYEINFTIKKPFMLPWT